MTDPRDFSGILETDGPGPRLPVKHAANHLGTQEMKNQDPQVPARLLRALMTREPTEEFSFSWKIQGGWLPAGFFYSQTRCGRIQSDPLHLQHFGVLKSTAIIMQVKNFVFTCVCVCVREGGGGVAMALAFRTCHRRGPEGPAGPAALCEAEAST